MAPLVMLIWCSAAMIPGDIDELVIFLLFLCLMAGSMLVLLGVCTDPGGAAPLGAGGERGASKEAGVVRSPEGREATPAARTSFGPIPLGLLLGLLGGGVLAYLRLPRPGGATLRFVPFDLELCLLFFFLCFVAGLMLLVFRVVSTKLFYAFSFYTRGSFPCQVSVHVAGSHHGGAAAPTPPSVQQRQPTGAISHGLVVLTLSCGGIIHLVVPKNGPSAGLVPASGELPLFLLFLFLMSGLVLVFLGAAATMPSQVRHSTQERGGAEEEAEMLGSPGDREISPASHKPMDGAMYTGLAVAMLGCGGLLHLLIPQEDGNVGVVSADLYIFLLLFLCLMADLMLLFMGASANRRPRGTVSLYVQGRRVGVEAALLGRPQGSRGPPPGRSMGAIRAGLMLVALSCAGLLHLLVPGYPPAKDP